MDDEAVAAIPEYAEGEALTREQASKPAATHPARAKERAENTNVDQYAPIMSEEQTQKAALQKAKAIADLIQEAVVHLDKEELSAAESKLNEVLMPEPQNVVALHYMAQTQLKKGDDSKAVDYLKRLVNLDAQNYPEDQWQLAQAYLRLNKKLAARSVLKEIAAQGGPYAEQAQELLNR
jgi:predicted Zn-dependent protease